MSEHERPAGTVHRGNIPADLRYDAVDRTLKQFQYRPDALIEVLHVAQRVFGYLSDDLMAYVASQLKVPQSRVYGVATFYHFFSLEPRGEHSCVVCTGTACHVKRSGEIVARLEHEFGVRAEETTADGKLTLSTVRCLGSCGLAPTVVLDGETLVKSSPESVTEAVRARLAGGSLDEIASLSAIGRPGRKPKKGNSP